MIQFCNQREARGSSGGPVGTAAADEVPVPLGLVAGVPPGPLVKVPLGHGTWMESSTTEFE